MVHGSLSYIGIFIIERYSLLFRSTYYYITYFYFAYALEIRIKITGYSLDAGIEELLDADCTESAKITEKYAF